jgi:hypothetical protein
MAALYVLFEQFLSAYVDVTSSQIEITNHYTDIMTTSLCLRHDLARHMWSGAPCFTDPTIGSAVRLALTALTPRKYTDVNRNPDKEER